MAGGISPHAVDVARGKPAQGMRVEIFLLTPERRRVAEGILGANGMMDDAIVRAADAGTYEAVFHIGDYLRTTDAVTDNPPFLDLVPFRFTVARADAHYHLPLKFTPWGFSLFRGS
jgi:5-hydroxyisourate hydrolase